MAYTLRCSSDSCDVKKKTLKGTSHHEIRDIYCQAKIILIHVQHNFLVWALGIKDRLIFRCHFTSRLKDNLKNPLQMLMLFKLKWYSH